MAAAYIQIGIEHSATFPGWAWCSGGGRPNPMLHDTSTDVFLLNAKTASIIAAYYLILIPPRSRMLESGPTTQPIILPRLLPTKAQNGFTARTGQPPLLPHGRRHRRLRRKRGAPFDDLDQVLAQGGRRIAVLYRALEATQPAAPASRSAGRVLVFSEYASRALPRPTTSLPRWPIPVRLTHGIFYTDGYLHLFFECKFLLCTAISFSLASSPSLSAISHGLVCPRQKGAMILTKCPFVTQHTLSLTPQPLSAPRVYSPSYGRSTL